MTCCCVAFRPATIRLWLCADCFVDMVEHAQCIEEHWGPLQVEEAKRKREGKSWSAKEQAAFKDKIQAG